MFISTLSLINAHVSLKRSVLVFFFHPCKYLWLNACVTQSIAPGREKNKNLENRVRWPGVESLLGSLTDYVSSAFWFSALQHHFHLKTVFILGKWNENSGNLGTVAHFLSIAAKRTAGKWKQEVLRVQRLAHAAVPQWPVEVVLSYFVKQPKHLTASYRSLAYAQTFIKLLQCEKLGSFQETLCLHRQHKGQLYTSLALAYMSKKICKVS